MKTTLFTDRRRVPWSLVCYRLVLLLTLLATAYSELVHEHHSVNRYETLGEEIKQPPSPLFRDPAFIDRSHKGAAVASPLLGTQ